MDNHIRHVSDMVEPKKDCSLVYDYDWDTRVAFGVCMGESGGNSQAIGDNYPINGLLAPSCGLMQIRTLSGRPTCEELLDPKTNMDWAYRISNNGASFTPWTAYTSGSYLKHI